MAALRFSPVRLRKLAIVSAAVCAMACAWFVARNVWRAQHALREAGVRTEAAAELPFSFETLQSRRGPQFRYFGVAADFRSAVPFEGELWVVGHAAVRQYRSDGELIKTWAVGAELPPFPLSSVAVRRGVATPELWVATEGGGVLVYAGGWWRQLLPAAAPLRKVAALLPLGDGRVLVGTRGAGLYVADGKHLRLLHAQFAKTEVTALAGDADQVWIGTRREGVWLWRAGEAIHYLSELPDAQVLSVFASGESAWVGTPVGVAEFAQGQYRRPLAEGVFAQSLLEQAGTLWIGTIDEGVVSVALKPRAMRASLAEGRRQGGENVVSLASAGGEVLAISPGHIDRVAEGTTAIRPAAKGLSDGHITALHADGRGRLWIGYFDHGLDIAEETPMRATQHFESELLFCVNRIKEDAGQAAVAVATANGLALFDAGGQLRQVLDRKSGLLADHVTDVLFRRTAGGSSSTVIATPAGLSFAEGGTISSIYAFQGLANNHVYTLAERAGTIYAGTLGGLSLLRNGSVEASYTTANSDLKQNWITASATAGDDVYLGTYGSGVMRADRAMNLTRFREFGGQRIEINPNALLVTEGFVYAGTAGQGLAVLRRGEERWRMVRDGLPSLNVTALEGRAGTVYIGTENGLVSVPEARLNP